MREKTIEISDLLGKQFIIIGSVRNQVDFRSKTTTVEVVYDNGMRDEFSVEIRMFDTGQSESRLVCSKIPAGARSASLTLYVQDYDAQKLIAFASDSGAACSPYDSRSGSAPGRGTRTGSSFGREKYAA
jgi:hypothetical protein